MLHDFARVLSTEYSEDACEVEAEVSESLKRRLAEYLALRQRRPDAHGLWKKCVGKSARILASVSEKGTYLKVQRLAANSDKS